MADERVQMKIEEVVGDDVVLRDINPKSSTHSIDDSSTGATLNETIDRLWNAINNKLSRVVNSVNGKTGVIVLNASDVGLGNVDNVSFADIKQWVINKLIEEFGNKRIKLFNNLQEVDTLVGVNDMINRDVPYYASHGYNHDYRAFIGYIYLDKGTNTLQHIHMPVETVGYTDNSLVYDEQINNNDKRGGGLGVNIYKYEDALEIYNASGPKNESGLRIDKSKIVSELYYFDGVYGDGTLTDEKALMYTSDNVPEINPKSVTMYVNDVFDGKIHFIRQTQMKKGDLILCNFMEYRTTEGLIPANMDAELMFRSQCIGRVHSAVEPDGSGTYVLKFYSIKPKLGWGMKYMETHKGQTVHDKEITLKLADGIFTPVGTVNDTYNMSGLQVMKSSKDPNVIDPDYESIIHESLKSTVLPHGLYEAFGTADGGLYISSDMSMCVMPYKIFGEGCPNGDTYEIDAKDINNNPIKIQRPYGCKFSDNWAIKSPINYNDASIDNGVLNDQCLVGINLFKGVDTGYTAQTHGATSRFINLSGLKINNPIDSSNHNYMKLTENDLGMKPGEYHKFNIGNDLDFDSVFTSGGLQVNVGAFLEISPGYYTPSSDAYYNGGKVNVRIGKGLTEETITDGEGHVTRLNKIQLKLGTDGGLGFDENGNLIIKEYNTTSKSLIFKDNYGTQLQYNPSTNTDGAMMINLGAGLKIIL